MIIDYVLVGKRIKEKRELNNLTKLQLAKISNFSNQHITNIEKGTGRPSIEFLVRIANILNVSVDYLLQDSIHVDIGEKSENLLSNLEYYLEIQQSGLDELRKIFKDIT